MSTHSPARSRALDDLLDTRERLGRLAAGLDLGGLGLNSYQRAKAYEAEALLAIRSLDRAMGVLEEDEGKGGGGCGSR